MCKSVYFSTDYAPYTFLEKYCKIPPPYVCMSRCHQKYSFEYRLGVWRQRLGVYMFRFIGIYTEVDPLFYQWARSSFPIFAPNF